MLLLWFQNWINDLSGKILGQSQQWHRLPERCLHFCYCNFMWLSEYCEMLTYFAFCSNFSEIFDVDWFISFLSKDVKIIKQLPTKGRKALSAYNMRVPRKCNERCYINRILPVLLKKHVSFFHFLKLQLVLMCRATH